MTPGERRLIVALDGTRGIRLGHRLLERLSGTNLEIHLIVSESTTRRLKNSEKKSVEDLHVLAGEHYHFRNIGAPMASGSWGNLGMIVSPCSMGFIGELARGITGDLLTRAADVTLKENRPLVLVPFEDSYTLPHLTNMEELIRADATLLPPSLPERESDEDRFDPYSVLADRLFSLCDFLPEP